MCSTKVEYNEPEDLPGYAAGQEESSKEFYPRGSRSQVRYNFTVVASEMLGHFDDEPSCLVLPNFLAGIQVSIYMLDVGKPKKRDGL